MHNPTTDNVTNDHLHPRLGSALSDQAEPESRSTADSRHSDPAAVLRTIADLVCTDGPSSLWAPEAFESVAQAIVDAGLAPPDVDETSHPSRRLPTVLDLTEREPHAHQAGPVLQSILEAVYPHHERGDGTPTSHCPIWLLDLLEAAELTYLHWPDTKPPNVLATEVERFISSLTPAERKRLQIALDDQVHDSTSDDAAAINNAGIAAQADYLHLTPASLQAVLDTPED